MPAFKLPKVLDDANPQLNASIGGSDTTIVLKSGEGSKLPTIYRGTATSAGTATTLNSTSIGSSGVAAGDYIENETDGSWAIVRSVDTNSIRTTPLRNGSDNTWDNSDAWVVNRFYCRLIKYDASGNISKKEKILVRNRSSDTLTVTRAQDGDSAQSFDADDYCELFVMKIQVDEIQKAICQTFLEFDAIARGEYDYAADTGSANAYAITMSPKVTALSDIVGKLIIFKAANANTNTSTLAVNGLSATAIKKEGGASDLASGDIAANMTVLCVYNGTSFVMVNAVANAPVTTDYTISDKTADYTVGTGESGKLFTNRGAAGPVVFTLPTATAGKHYQFSPVADVLMIVAGSGDLIYDESGNSSSGLIGGAGRTVIELTALDATDWILSTRTGKWGIAKGYVAGGSTTSGDGGAVTAIEDFNFTTEASAAITATITTAVVGASGVSSHEKGYVFGGANTSGTAISTGNRFTFATETKTTMSATLDTARYMSCSVESSNFGYFLGGDNNSGSYFDSIGRFVFSDETEANVSSTLPAGMSRQAPVSSTTAGYAMGGNSGAASNGIVKMLFSTEVTSTLAATLGASKSNLAGVNSMQAGYSMGGATVTNAIYKLAFPGETSSTLAATLDNSTHSMTGIHAQKGYGIGGANGATIRAVIEDLNFITEASAAIAATLDTAKQNCCGFQPVSK